MRISDWSSDVCSSDLDAGAAHPHRKAHASEAAAAAAAVLDVGALTAPTPAHRKSLPVVKPADPFIFGLLAGPCRDRQRVVVGKECVSTCRSRWSPDHSIQTN